jgi:hypothetical protein
MAQTLKSQGQTSFSSYSSKACAVMYTNKQDLVSSVSEVTFLMFTNCCYIVKNWKTPALLFAGVKKDRDLLVQKGKTACIFHGQTWGVASSGARADHRPLYYSRVPVEVSGAVREDCCMQGILLDCQRQQVKRSTVTHRPENGKHLKSRVMNKDTARMFAGWVVATCYLPWNLVYVLPSYPYQKLFPSLWTVWAG